MALTPGQFFPNDLVDTLETLTLKAADPAVPTQANIVDAYYGLDANGQPIPVTVTGGLSVTFTVIAGVHPLIVNLNSPAPQNELVELVQNSFIASEFVMRNHTATTTILIQGLVPATTSPQV